MNKKHITIAVAVGVILCAGLGFLIYSLWQEKAEKEELLMLAEMDKREMENEYASFAKQYSEMKTQINNDSLIAQLDKEQQRTEALLEELRQVKATDAAEIRRLKKELSTGTAMGILALMILLQENKLRQFCGDSPEHRKQIEISVIIGMEILFLHGPKMLWHGAWKKVF